MTSWVYGATGAYEEVALEFSTQSRDIYESSLLGHVVLRLLSLHPLPLPQHAETSSSHYPHTSVWATIHAMCPRRYISSFTTSWQWKLIHGYPDSRTLCLVTVSDDLHHTDKSASQRRGFGEHPHGKLAGCDIFPSMWWSERWYTNLQLWGYLHVAYYW